jgi:hypothetical protein
MPCRLFVVSQRFANFNTRNIFVILYLTVEGKVPITKFEKSMSAIEPIGTSEIMEISDFQGVEETPGTESRIRRVKKSDN